MNNYEEMQKNVQRIAMKSYKERLVAGTSGNVSQCDQANGIMAITPSNLDYTIMTPEDIIIMKLDGEIIRGELKPSSEWQMHAEIYRNKKDVNAIMHTHSPRATSFAVVHEPIPVILVEMMPFLGGDIPLAEFALPGTVELGMSCVKVLNNRNSCLMENHGVVIIGKNIDQAYIRAVYVEDAATIYHYARQLGQPKLVPEFAIDVMKVKYNLK